MAAIGGRPPFTAAQWAELEHQALIFKYMMAGVPVPPELLLPIHRSFESMAARLYHHPTLGYCSYYGKKLDPEPGRCRRTDGKKWRCAKDAYPDSKYCERHMHRGRSRSRKPVEAHPLPQSQSPSSTVTSLTPTGSNGSNGSGSSSGNLQNIPLNSHRSGSDPRGSYAGESGGPQLHLQSSSYGLNGLNNKNFRYIHGMKPEIDEQRFFTETSRSPGTISSLDSPWRAVPSSVPSFALSTARNGSVVQSNYPLLQSLQDYGHGTVNLLSKQHQHSGIEFGSSGTEKHETQSLRPFFDEWPKTRDSWSDLDENSANHASFSTTQLSMSIPMASSDFSTTSSRSPNGADD